MKPAFAPSALSDHLFLRRLRAAQRRVILPD